MPEALVVLSPVLCSTVSTKKQTSEASQERKSRAETCLAPHIGSCPKPWRQWGRTGVLRSKRWCCSLLLLLGPIPELQEFIPRSILPVPTSLGKEHLTGGGSTRRFSQGQNGQRRNRRNGTKQPSPPSSSETSRKAIIQAQQCNSNFILARRCFRARGPASTLEIIHVFHVLAAPSSCEITRQG